MGAEYTKEDVFHFIKNIVDAKTADILLSAGVDGLTLSTSSEAEVTDASMAIEDIAMREMLLEVWKSNFPLETSKEMGDPSAEALFKGNICKLVLFKRFKHHFLRK